MLGRSVRVRWCGRFRVAPCGNVRHRARKRNSRDGITDAVRLEPALLRCAGIQEIAACYQFGWGPAGRSCKNSNAENSGGLQQASANPQPALRTGRSRGGIRRACWFSRGVVRHVRGAGVLDRVEDFVCLSLVSKKSLRFVLVLTLYFEHSPATHTTQQNTTTQQQTQPAGSQAARQTAGSQQAASRQPA